MASTEKVDSSPSSSKGLAFAVSASDGPTANVNEADVQNEIPLLPPSDPNSDLPSLKLGESMSLEEMGPIIINVDGSTRRIDNWDEMTEQEREVAWRRISKRNAERRKKLLEQQQQSQDEQKTDEL